MSTPPKPDATAQTKTVVAWLEANLGSVTAIELQPRWRPMWFADVEKDGATLKVCVRGDRVDSIQTFPLEHEMLAQRFMWEHGIPVPKVYGWIDGIRAFAMEAIPGRADFGDLTDDQRRAVMRDYMHALARLHKLDVNKAAVAGIMRPPTREARNTFGIERYRAKFRKLKRRPEPFVEFMLAWIDRHPLAPHDRESLIVWDSGQLHQKDGTFLSFIDLELSHVGDPMMDLAAFRMRETVLHHGDFRELYGFYEEAAGSPVDWAAIQHHHIFMTMTNAFSFSGALAEPAPASDFMTNMQWINETNRFAIEAVAEYMEIELPEVPLPEPMVTTSAVPFAHLIRSLQSIELPDEYTRFKLRGLFRLARHLDRTDEIGRQVVEANLDDIGDVLRRRPKTWQEGDVALEQFVLADGGKHDRELVLLFNRRLRRAQSMNGPPGSAMVKHLPIQAFGGRMR